MLDPKSVLAASQKAKYAVIGLVTFWLFASFVSALVSISTQRWLYDAGAAERRGSDRKIISQLGGRTSLGLWKTCYTIFPDTKECVDTLLSGAPKCAKAYRDHVRTTRAFMIMGIVIGLFAFVTSAMQYLKKMYKPFVPAALSLVASLFYMIAMFVFLAASNKGYCDQPSMRKGLLDLSISFFLCMLSMVLCFLGFFTWMFIWKSQPKSATDGAGSVNEPTTDVTANAIGAPGGPPPGNWATTDEVRIQPNTNSGGWNAPNGSPAYTPATPSSTIHQDVRVESVTDGNYQLPPSNFV